MQLSRHPVHSTPFTFTLLMNCSLSSHDSVLISFRRPFSSPTISSVANVVALALILVALEPTRWVAGAGCDLWAIWLYMARDPTFMANKWLPLRVRGFKIWAPLRFFFNTVGVRFTLKFFLPCKLEISPLSSPWHNILISNFCCHQNRGRFFVTNGCFDITGDHP